jgi:sugar phosphate isomerase/epimerase
MNTRRNFIKTSAFATAGVLMASPFLTMAAEGKNKLKNFGFISGIAGEAMKADWKGTLKQAVEFGFTEIEGGSNHAGSPQEFLSFCKGIGIKPIAGALDFKTKSEDLNKVFDNLNELKMKYAVVYWPWMGGGPFMLDDCKKSCERLNELGAKTKQNGLQLLWHNHDKEFHEMEDGLPFDYLMKNTDPKLVQCEMDIYWVKKGGADPLEFLKKYAGRIPVLHVKDMAPGPEQDFICPGRGIIDFVPIFAEAKKQKIEHYFVERDNEPDGIGCLKSSGEFLKNLRF